MSPRIPVLRILTCLLLIFIGKVKSQEDTNTEEETEPDTCPPNFAGHQNGCNTCSSAKCSDRFAFGACTMMLCISPNGTDLPAYKCHCSGAFRLNSAGDCVRKEECDPPLATCPPNFMGDPAGCNQCSSIPCETDITVPVCTLAACQGTLPNGQPVPQFKCYCGGDYRLDEAGNCIPKELCPSLTAGVVTQGGSYGVEQICPLNFEGNPSGCNQCESVACGSLSGVVACPLMLMECPPDAVTGQARHPYKCYCGGEYRLNNQGACIPKAQCPLLSSTNNGDDPAIDSPISIIGCPPNQSGHPEGCNQCASVRCGAGAGGGFPACTRRACPPNSDGTQRPEHKCYCGGENRLNTAGDCVPKAECRPAENKGVTTGQIGDEAACPQNFKGHPDGCNRCMSEKCFSTSRGAHGAAACTKMLCAALEDGSPRPPFKCYCGGDYCLDEFGACISKSSSVPGSSPTTASSGGETIAAI